MPFYDTRVRISKQYLSIECIFFYVVGPIKHQCECEYCALALVCLSIFILMSICKKYLCIVGLKPLYTPLVRDMKYGWNSHNNTLLSLLLRQKI